MMADAGAPLYPTETTQGHVASASLQTSLHPQTLLEPERGPAHDLLSQICQFFKDSL